MAAIGENPPGSTGNRDVGDDLGDRALRELTGHSGTIQRPAEPFGVCDGRRVLIPRETLGASSGLAITLRGEERVVRLAAPVGQRHVRLNGPSEAKQPQDRLDPAILRLGLVRRFEFAPLRFPQSAHLLE